MRKHQNLEAWAGIQPQTKSLPVRGGVISTFFREQNRRGTSVRLRDDPEFDPLRGTIRRQQARASLQGQFVLLAVLLRRVAPITGNGGFGERVRLARRVWRPAKHIPAWLLLEGGPSETESMGRNRQSGGARDAPHGDRDGRAPNPFTLLRESTENVEEPKIPPSSPSGVSAHFLRNFAQGLRVYLSAFGRKHGLLPVKRPFTHLAR